MSQLSNLNSIAYQMDFPRSYTDLNQHYYDGYVLDAAVFEVIQSTEYTPTTVYTGQTGQKRIEVHGELQGMLRQYENRADGLLFTLTTPNASCDIYAGGKVAQYCWRSSTKKKVEQTELLLALSVLVYEYLGGTKHV